MKEKYLPIGTVVWLKGGKKRAMITGFCSVAQENQDKIYDYSGCVYPEGYLSSNQVCLFDHDQIEKIFFVGFEDEEEKSFKEKLNTIVANLEAESAADAEATTPAPESLSETLEEPVVNTETESLENAEETLIDVPVVGTQETGTETEESGIKPFGE